MSNDDAMRLVDNEVVFRHHNEQVKRGFEHLKRVAEEDGQANVVVDEDMPLYFYCECADENCKQRILVRPSEYNRIHQSRSQFIILPGHEVERVERIVQNGTDFSVVAKFIEPAPDAKRLHKTDVDNA